MQNQIKSDLLIALYHAYKERKDKSCICAQGTVAVLLICIIQLSSSYIIINEVFAITD